MAKCKHENAEHMLPGDSSTPDWLVSVYAQCEQFRCIDCGAWLSLGPAPAPLRDELRLARSINEICRLWEKAAQAYMIDDLAGFMAAQAKR